MILAGAVPWFHCSIQWLADKLLQRREEQKSDLKEKRDRMAGYFKTLGATLEAMHGQFVINKIRRVDGHTFNLLLNNFTRVVHGQGAAS